MTVTLPPIYGDTMTTMTAHRDGDRVHVAFYPAADDNSRREAARVVRTYTRTVSGIVTAHARYVGVQTIPTATGPAVVHTYRLTDKRTGEPYSS